MADTKFLIPQDAAELPTRSDILPNDFLLVMRTGVPPMKIKASKTGVTNLLTIGDPDGVPIDGDKKIVDETEYTYINGEWVVLYQVVKVHRFSGNGDRTHIFDGNGDMSALLVDKK